MALSALVCLIAGCSEKPSAATSATSNTAYTAEFKAAAGQAKSDFERQVLSDGTITVAEYAEAVNRLVKCAADRGVLVSATMKRGLYSYSAPSSGDSVFTDCSVANTYLIESLYAAVVKNPMKQNMDDLTALCLRRSGLADASFNAEEYHRISRSNGALSFPFDVEDSRYGDCELNPSGPVPTATPRP